MCHLQAIKAEADGADYLGAGAVYPTDTKESDVIGLDALAAICQVGCQAVQIE